MSSTSTASTQISHQRNSYVRDDTLTDDLLEVLELRRTHDGRSDAFLREAPRRRDLRHREPLLLRELLDPRNHNMSIMPILRSV